MAVRQLNIATCQFGVKPDRESSQNHEVDHMLNKFRKGWAKRHGREPALTQYLDN